MIKKISIIVIFILLGCWTSNSFAFWIWTPETNRWINPKYSVKETPIAQLEFAKEFLDSKDYEKALDEFRKLLKHYPRAREAAEAQFFIAETLEKMNRLFDAFKAYQLVIDKYPFSERFPEVNDREFDIGSRLMEGEGDNGGLWGTVIGSNYNVIEVFQTVIKNSPYGKHAAASQYKIGLYLQGKKLYQEARDEFEKVLNDYPDTEWAKAAKYQLALTDAHRSADAQYDQKVTQVAVEEFKEFVKNNPDAELSEKAQSKIKELREKDAENNFLVAHYYEKQKKYKAARIYYSDIVRDFQDTRWAKEAEDRIRALDAQNAKMEKKSKKEK